jgi:hypothetical protein
VDGAWFVKIVSGIGWWCVVCIGKEVENGVVVVYEMANGQCELWGLMKHDEL